MKRKVLKLLRSGVAVVAVVSMLGTMPAYTLTVAAAGQGVIKNHESITLEIGDTAILQGERAYGYSDYDIQWTTENDGIINMFLDESHTNSNAALYNSAGQSVGSRYIKKGETNPSMNAVGLPDGIYNLVLERNGQQLSNQKMLIK